MMNEPVGNLLLQRDLGGRAADFDPLHPERLTRRVDRVIVARPAGITYPRDRFLLTAGLDSSFAIDVEILED